MAAVKEPRTPKRRISSSMMVIVLGLIAVVVAATVVVWLQSDTEGDARPDVARPGVSADALSPAGTPLPDGFTVPEGADLIATPMRYQVDYPEAKPDWQAVLLVNDDPIATWSALLRQMAMVLGAAVDADNAEGCGVFEEQLGCSLVRNGSTGPGDELSVTATLRAVPGDVTGHYTIWLVGQRTPDPNIRESSDPWPGGDPPTAPGARPRPVVGEPLAPQGLAQGDEPEDHPLLEGSELLVQYSPGSLTGGFSVLLRVLPGADVDAVGRAYAEQQGRDGPIYEEITETDGMTVTVYSPPGGGGGYSATVYGVDNASGADYIYYELFND